jgi:uncharacterized RDD family membrane protein YckC
MPPPAGEGTPYGPGPWPVQPYGAGDEPSAHPYAYEPEYGGRWRRLVAAIIDGVLVSAVTWLLTAPILGVNMVREGNFGRQTAADLLGGLVAFLYYVLQHGRWGQTLGKRAMSLRVVREDGGPIGYGQAAWRLLFAYLISLATCGVGGLIDVAWILWDRRRQALHDKVARTLVLAAGSHTPDPYQRQPRL